MLKFFKRKPQPSRTETNGPSAGLGYTDQIGAMAGKVWQLLDQNGEMKFSLLVKQANASRDEVMQAIGWLARENKIQLAGKGKARSVALAGDAQHCRAA